MIGRSIWKGRLYNISPKIVDQYSVKHLLRNILPVCPFPISPQKCRNRMINLPPVLPAFNFSENINSFFINILLIFSGKAQSVLFFRVRYCMIN